MPQSSETGEAQEASRRSVRLRFENTRFRYEPFPLGVMRPALEAATYRELVASFPDLSLFGSVPGYDDKYSLSEKFNPRAYHEFIRSSAPWSRFHAWIKSDDFIRGVIACLKRNHVDLLLDDGGSSGSVARQLVGALHRRRLRAADRLRTRFEFSALEADGGEVAPHTDTPKKVVTLVLSMVTAEEWPDPSIGGLDVNRATDPAFAFNWANRIVPWDKVEVKESIPFLPNQCVVFVKTFNSLHSVRRMTCRGSTALRKTVTIVIHRRG